MEQELGQKMLVLSRVVFALYHASVMYYILCSYVLVGSHIVLCDAIQGSFFVLACCFEFS